MKKTYEEKPIETTAIDKDIPKAELELANGKLLYDARTALTALREKHFGKSPTPCSADAPPAAPANPARPRQS